MTIAVGYVNWWNGVAFINDTTRFATTYAGIGVVVKPRIIVLSGGVLVNYDGAGPSPTTPGMVVQEFFDTGSSTFLDSLEGQKGVQARVYLREPHPSSDTEYADAILLKVEDVTPVQGNRGRVWGKATWRIVGDWT